MGKIAVIKTGGKQYLIKEGDILSIEKIRGQVGDKIFLKDVLLFVDSKQKKTAIGRPILNVSVEAEIISQSKGKKIDIIKYKPKTRYFKKQGHRQCYTEIKILTISPEKQK
ncbi:50S ribosomal protein L21 [Candidatus Parcubacteria bacterium 4484_255]|nr:MAG: 50S ribosomal protein L21 [Candidatus Parcubacteria bacterium 4484_255]